MCFHSSAARKNRSKACAKISACSWRLTKIDSSVVKTSARLPISITCSAFMASMIAPGPTGMPAARNARAKPTTLSAILPERGVEVVDRHRTSYPVKFAMRIACGQFSLVASFKTFCSVSPCIRAISSWYFKQRAKGVADHLRGQRAGVEFAERGGPVDGLGDARRFVEILVAQRLHEAHDLLREFCRDAGHARLDDRKLALGEG